jgi:hypothetical protein
VRGFALFEILELLVDRDDTAQHLVMPDALVQHDRIVTETGALAHKGLSEIVQVEIAKGSIL